MYIAVNQLKHSQTFASRQVFPIIYKDLTLSNPTDEKIQKLFQTTKPNQTNGILKTLVSNFSSLRNVHCRWRVSG